MTAEPEQPRPPTYNDISIRYGARVWEAIERRDELGRRHHSADAEATLKARGEWDPAKYGPGGAQPLTLAEQLERIALDEYISRHYQPHYQLDGALKAGATLAQVADALGIREDAAGARIRQWAEGQHWLLTTESAKFGMSDEDYQAVLRRIGEGTSDAS